jgi:hypothetical protein
VSEPVPPHGWATHHADNRSVGSEDLDQFGHG